MRLSHPTVHPVEAPPPLPPPTTDALVGVPPPRIRMKDIQGMPGTAGGLALRCLQFIFALVALCVMASTPDFPSVTAFRYMVAVVALQFLWSFSLAIVDTYALLVGRCLRKYGVVCLFAIGDGLTAALTFAAASASAGITILIGNDLNNCAMNHCFQFQTATAMTFLSWFVVSPSFFLNFWSLAAK